MGKGKEGKKKKKRKVEGKVKDKPRKKEQGSPRRGGETAPVVWAEEADRANRKLKYVCGLLWLLEWPPGCTAWQEGEEEPREGAKEAQTWEEGRRWGCFWLARREPWTVQACQKISRPPPRRATSWRWLSLHRDRLNPASMWVQREMRTVAKSLDLVAMGEPQRAADVLAQRLKALELMLSMLSDQAHIELLPAEGATLVEPDESWVATREHVFENKLRQWKGKGVGKEADGKGKAERRKKRYRRDKGGTASRPGQRHPPRRSKGWSEDKRLTGWVLWHGWARRWWARTSGDWFGR